MRWKTGKESQFDTKRGDMNTAKNYNSHFGRVLRRGPTPAAKMRRQNPEKIRERPTTENEKVNINFCVCPLFSRDVLFLSVDS